jgi:hypothetical protein
LGLFCLPSAGQGNKPTQDKLFGKEGVFFSKNYFTLTLGGVSATNIPKTIVYL